jgi:formylglycine-generating enzyme required for sulfatase activity
MLKKRLDLIISFVLLAVLPLNTYAALSSKKGATSDPVVAYNPHQDAMDFELPMPNNLKMVLRMVAIPSSNFFTDKKFEMGLSEIDEDRGFYEKKVDSYISSSIYFDDLPKEWQKKVPKDEQKGFCFYFVGKYEITNAQWYAVMGGEPKDGERGELPKANISWYDIQDFLKIYNEWLLANHADKIPVMEGNPLFLRLPTEEEWEFAARGGNLPPEIIGNSNFVLDEGKSVEDYAVFGQGYSEARPIGSKLPNRLGLYDTAGNVAEFVQNGFRFTIPESLPGGAMRTRLHGSEGGILCKGGHFLSSEEKDVYPGTRVEMKMFDKADKGYIAHRMRSLGFRVTLSSINVPGMKRSSDLSKLLDKLGGGVANAAIIPAKPEKESKPEAKEKKGEDKIAVDKLVKIDKNGDLLVEFDKIYGSASSPFMKSNLTQYKALLKDYNSALNRERDENLFNNMRSTLYMADSMCSYGIFFFDVYNKYTVLLKNSKDKMTKELESLFMDNIKKYYNSLEISTSIYRNALKEIAAFPKDEINEKLVHLRKEYQGDSHYNKIFLHNIEVFSKQIDFVRSKGYDKLTNKKIWGDFLSEKNNAKIAEWQKSRK